MTKFEELCTKPLKSYETDDEYAAYLCGDWQRVEHIRQDGGEPLDVILAEGWLTDDM